MLVKCWLAASASLGLLTLADVHGHTSDVVDIDSNAALPVGKISSFGTSDGDEGMKALSHSSRELLWSKSYSYKNGYYGYSKSWGKYWHDADDSSSDSKNGKGRQKSSKSSKSSKWSKWSSSGKYGNYWDTSSSSDENNKKYGKKNDNKNSWTKGWSKDWYKSWYKNDDSSDSSDSSSKSYNYGKDWNKKWYKSWNKKDWAKVTPRPTRNPTDRYAKSTPKPTGNPTDRPTKNTPRPTGNPTDRPSRRPTGNPTDRPTKSTPKPTGNPTDRPSRRPTGNPTDRPSRRPTGNPTDRPTKRPTGNPTDRPTTPRPTPKPTPGPTRSPTPRPTPSPTTQPTSDPTPRPTLRPTMKPTPAPAGEFCKELEDNRADIVILVDNGCPITGDECIVQNLFLSELVERIYAPQARVAIITYNSFPDLTDVQFADLNNFEENRAEAIKNAEELVCNDNGEDLDSSIVPAVMGAINYFETQDLGDGAQRRLVMLSYCGPSDLNELEVCDQFEGPWELEGPLEDAGIKTFVLNLGDSLDAFDQYLCLTPDAAPLDNFEFRQDIDFDMLVPQVREKIVSQVCTRPTQAPTRSPSDGPTKSPTRSPSDGPTKSPTDRPTPEPSAEPTEEPTENPTPEPSNGPTRSPTDRPTDRPTESPTDRPTDKPTDRPTDGPTKSPTDGPTPSPTTPMPTMKPTNKPTPAPAGEFCKELEENRADIVILIDDGCRIEPEECIDQNLFLSELVERLYAPLARLAVFQYNNDLTPTPIGFGDLDDFEQNREEAIKTVEELFCNLDDPNLNTNIASALDGVIDYFDTNTIDRNVQRRLILISYCPPDDFEDQFQVCDAFEEELEQNDIKTYILNLGDAVDTPDQYICLTPDGDEEDNSDAINPIDLDALIPDVRERIVAQVCTKPTPAPTPRPTDRPTDGPTDKPTRSPTDAPTNDPVVQPTNRPTLQPTAPTSSPTFPTLEPTFPTFAPTPPTAAPTPPTAAPTPPTAAPTPPTAAPTGATPAPTGATGAPTRRPSGRPNDAPTPRPTEMEPTPKPTERPSDRPTAPQPPTPRPTTAQTPRPTVRPTVRPTRDEPTRTPKPSMRPTPGSFECPRPCSAYPCPCEENTYCLAETCQHANGCDQCRDGFWKLGYGFYCESCDMIPNCKSCSDFNGCQQCEVGYKRVQSETCLNEADQGIWYCEQEACDPYINMRDTGVGQWKKSNQGQSWDYSGRYDYVQWDGFVYWLRQDKQYMMALQKFDDDDKTYLVVGNIYDTTGESRIYYNVDVSRWTDVKNPSVATESGDDEGWKCYKGGDECQVTAGIFEILDCKGGMLKFCDGDESKFPEFITCQNGAASTSKNAAVGRGVDSVVTIVLAGVVACWMW